LINPGDYVQFGMAGAVLIAIAMFLWFQVHQQKMWNEMVKGVLEANNEIMKRVLVQLGKSEGNG